MDAILERCAGLDIHQETVVACFLLGPLDKKPAKEVETFGTTTKELLRLQDWLVSRECKEVAMESTGVYWKPIWNILEDACRLTLANPERIKNVPAGKPILMMRYGLLNYTVAVSLRRASSQVKIFEIYVMSPGIVESLFKM